MLFKTNATSIQQLRSYVQRMARHRRANKFCLWTIQTPTNTIPTQWNRLMNFVLKIVKKIKILKNAHAKTESNSKREKVKILKMIRTVLTNVLLVGLE